MSLKRPVLFLLLCSCTSAYAQKEYRLFDSIRYDLKHKSRFVLGFDSKRSFISDLPIKVFGVRGGWEYNSRTSLLIGLYNTTDKQKTTDSTTNVSGKKDIYKSSVGLGYISGVLEYVFYTDKRWELSVPAQLGIGSGRRNYYRNDTLIRNEVPFVMPFETGLNASYKLAWWCGLSAGVGLRFSLANTSEYNGAFYSFGFQIYTGAMYRRWIKKKKE